MFGREPTVIAAAIRAVILCAVAFGLQWSPDQIAAIMLAVEAVLAVVVRQQVTPVSQPKLPLGTPVLVEGTGDTPPPDAAVLPVR
jgi:hypothetical protein